MSAPSALTAVRRPPIAGRLLLRLAVWGRAHEVIAGDLEEEFLDETLPRLGTLNAWLWFYRQTLCSIFGYYRLTPQDAHQGDDSMLQDLFYGLRMLRKNYGFTAAAVLTLGLGIGANTAIFSVINTLLLKPLPYADSERVTFLLGWDLEEDAMRFNLSSADYTALVEQALSFEHLASYRYWDANLTSGDQPERLQVYRTTPNLFTLLGVEPLHGRFYTAGESGDDRVVVISHRLFERRFGADPGVVGREVTLDGGAFTVIGVMPESFEFPIFNWMGELWVPFTEATLASLSDRATSFSIVTVGRLAPGRSLDAAQAEIDALMQRLATDYIDTNKGLGARVLPMQEVLAERMRPALFVVFAAVTLVLLMACANVANLLLARAIARGRELAVRTALGAGTGRLVRQLLTESLLLAVFGGAMGVAVAYLGLRGIRAALPEMLFSTTAGLQDLGLDRNTLLFALGASLVTGVTFGLVPAWRSVKNDLQSQLREGAHNNSSSKRRLRQALVTAEVALSVLLLVVTGLLVRSFAKLMDVNPGFHPDNVLALSVALPGHRYTNVNEITAFVERAEERIAALPSVEAVGIVNRLPFSTSNSATRFVVEGRPAPAPSEKPFSDFRVINHDYLAAMKIPLREGRGVTAGDRLGAPRVALVNEVLAERYFPGEEVIGRRVRFDRDPSGEFYEIVGLVGNVRHWTLSANLRPEVYVPVAQMPLSRMTLAVRSAESPENLIHQIRAEIRAVDPQQPIYHIKPLATMVSDAHMAQTASLVMVTIFAALALVLASLGLYGVIAYSVSQSTREIGVRMALGARASNVLAKVLREGMVLVAVGVVIGLVGAWGVTRFLSSLLYAVSPQDLVSFLAALPVLVAVALVACLVPARRATRIDPVVALRVD